jgi:ribosomal protein S14
MPVVSGAVLHSHAGVPIMVDRQDVTGSHPLVDLWYGAQLVWGAAPLVIIRNREGPEMKNYCTSCGRWSHIVGFWLCRICLDLFYDREAARPAV